MKLFLFEDRAVEKAIFHSILVEIVEGCLDNKGIFIFNVFLISSLFLPESFWFRKKKFEESRELILLQWKNYIHNNKRSYDTFFAESHQFETSKNVSLVGVIIPCGLKQKPISNSLWKYWWKASTSTIDIVILIDIKIITIYIEKFLLVYNITVSEFFDLFFDETEKNVFKFWFIF